MSKGNADSTFFARALLRQAGPGKVFGGFVSTPCDLDLDTDEVWEVAIMPLRKLAAGQAVGHHTIDRVLTGTALIDPTSIEGPGIGESRTGGRG